MLHNAINNEKIITKKFLFFKADIEGAALPVLNQMILNKIYPDQIIVEFERPKKEMPKIIAFLKDVSF